jgi:hypothetical protein
MVDEIGFAGSTASWVWIKKKSDLSRKIFVLNEFAEVDLGPIWVKY